MDGSICIIDCHHISLLSTYSFTYSSTALRFAIICACNKLSYTGELQGLNEEFFNHIAPICKGFGASGLRTEDEKEAAAARKDATVQQYMYVMMRISCRNHDPTAEVQQVNGANQDVVLMLEGGALAEKSQKLHYLAKHLVAVYYYRGRSEDFRSHYGLLWPTGKKGLDELLVQQVKTHARKAPKFWMVVSDNNYKQMDDENDKKSRNAALMRQLQVCECETNLLLILKLVISLNTHTHTHQSIFVEEL